LTFDSCINEKSELLSKKVENEKDVLEKARKQADEIIRQAELEAAKILEEAKEKGTFVDGGNRGRQQAKGI